MKIRETVIVCKKCRSGRVSKDRRIIKQELVNILGGKCSKCKYDKSVWSLQFHHLDSSSKEYEIGDLIKNRDRKRLKEEIKKCILVCANCHGEIEEQIYLDSQI